MMLTLGLCALLCACTTLNNARAQSVDEPEALESVVAQLSDAVDHLQAQCTADVTRLETRIAAMQARLDSATRQSAFLAQFSAPKITTPTSGVLRFDHVIFNDGGNYDSTQGLFTAPFTGVYIFSVKVFTGEQESTRPALDLVRNGAVVDRLAYDYLSTQLGHGGESHSLTLTLRLGEGDRVGVQTVPGFDPDQLYGGFHTSFSGGLLYAD